MPEAPVLSNTQRREAYDLSLKVRRDRALVKEYLSEAGQHLELSLEAAWDMDPAQGMKVYDLLTALPGVGKRKATAMLDTAGIPVKNTVRACGPRQRERLFDLLR